MRVTGDLLWEHRRERPDDLEEFILRVLSEGNRNISIYGDLIIDTSNDDHVFALDAATGRVVWDTEVLDYRQNPAHQTSGRSSPMARSCPAGGAYPRAAPTPAWSRPTMR